MDVQELKRQILNHIDGDEVVALTQRLIQFPSENPPGDTRPITDFVAGYLKEQGVESTVLSADPKLPNLVARIPGSSGRRLIFNGHLDVVPAGDRSRWLHDPFGGDIVDGYIWGRGASDMKAGTAGIICAFVAASKLPELPGELLLLLVPDEETGGQFGSAWVLDELQLTADGCVIAEPSKDTPTVGQKGSLWLKVTTFGTPEHGSLSPVLNDNAIRKMQQACAVIYTVWDQEWEMPDEILPLLETSRKFVQSKRSDVGLERVLDHVSVNIGTIRGGDKVNKIPDHCEAEFDLRTPFGVNPQTVVNWIREQLAAAGVEAQLETSEQLLPANYTLPSEAVVQSVVNCGTEILGRPVTASLQWASSDARHFRLRGIPTIQFGPAELDGIHSYNERVQVEEVRDCARVYAAVVVDFLSR